MEGEGTYFARVCRSIRRENSYAQNKHLSIQYVAGTRHNRRIYLEAIIGDKNICLQPIRERTLLLKRRLGVRNNFLTLGCFRSTVAIQGNKADIDIHVAEREGVNLLGLDGIEALNQWGKPQTNCQISTSAAMSIWTREGDTANGPQCTERTQSGGTLSVEIRDKFPELFSGELGTCKHFLAKFHLAPDARIVQRSHRPIPYAMEERLNLLHSRQKIYSPNGPQTASRIIANRRH